LNKKLLIILSLTILLFSDTVTVDITADKFVSNKSKNITIFTGNVKMIKQKDFIICDKLTIKTLPSKNNQETIAEEYIAIGNASFSLTSLTSVIKGKGDKIHYYPLDFKYIVVGNGYLEDIKDGRVLIGDKIFLDEKSGNANIEGQKDKPVKFTFKMKVKDK